LKNNYIWSSLEVPADILNHFWVLRGVYDIYESSYRIMEMTWEGEIRGPLVDMYR
jgi:hypothetical protein